MAIVEVRQEDHSDHSDFAAEHAVEAPLVDEAMPHALVQTNLRLVASMLAYRTR
jgi:hypothetical protein